MGLEMTVSEGCSQDLARRSAGERKRRSSDSTSVSTDAKYTGSFLTRWAFATVDK